MPKMTTEQFLSHLGIEVDKEFRMSETFPSRKYKVDKNYELHFREHDSFEWQKSKLNLDDLLDEEIKQITPLPKYTLTEDEKAIVRNMSKSIGWLGKDGDNLYGHVENRDPFWLPFSDMFNFVGQGIKGEVSLDELRKCL